MKTAVIFCTHIINDELEYFMNNGFAPNDLADFYFCFNGAFPIEEYELRAKNAGFDNIFFKRRENAGHDFSGWSEILFDSKDEKKVYESYDYFIFINSSCMGPFVPVYENTNWIELFTGMITDKIKLVGPTANLHYGNPHIQSYMMCTDSVGIRIAIETGVFSPNGFAHIDKDELILKCEIGFSLNLINRGYEIKSLLKAQDMIDYNKYYQDHNILNICNLLSCNDGKPDNHDNMLNNRYCGITIHPYEVIFYKSNRTKSDILQVLKKTHSYNKPNYFVKLINLANKKEIFATYGAEESLDITKIFVANFVSDNKIIIPENMWFNELFGDVCIGKQKCLTVRIKDLEIETLSENVYIVQEKYKGTIIINIS